MSHTSEEIMKIIKELKMEDDIVYEVFKTKKRSGWFHFWDILFDVIPSSADKLLNQKVVYVIASDTSGKIVEFENGIVKHSIEIPEWSKSDKTTFKKTVMNGYVYKKYRVLD